MVLIVTFVIVVQQIMSKPQGWNIGEIARDAAIGAETGVFAGSARGDGPGQIPMDAYIGGETGALIGETRGYRG
jgi:hypothetical protein